MGSKSRIAKHIVPIIQRYIDENNIKCYIEPFCGGLNVIDKVKCEYKIASDIHRYLIALFKNIDKIYTLPDFITKEHYSEVRECFNENNNCLEDWYIGAIRFLASYNGRFFDGGYAGLVNTKSGATRTVMIIPMVIMIITDQFFGTEIKIRLIMKMHMELCIASVIQNMD